MWPNKIPEACRSSGDGTLLLISNLRSEISNFRFAISNRYTPFMEFAARQFARRVLAFHLALLCVVLLAVGLAARVLYASARRQVMAQAEGPQQVLRRQTRL